MIFNLSTRVETVTRRYDWTSLLSFSEVFLSRRTACWALSLTAAIISLQFKIAPFDLLGRGIATCPACPPFKLTTEKIEPPRLIFERKFVHHSPLPLDHFFFCFFAPVAAGAILTIDMCCWLGCGSGRRKVDVVIADGVRQCRGRANF